MFRVVFDRSTLHAVGDFVADRIDDDVRRADEAGDKPALSFAIGSRDLVALFRRDIDQRPWARTEVGRYLLRAARLHRDHPDFRAWWA